MQNKKYKEFWTNTKTFHLISQQYNSAYEIKKFLIINIYYKLRTD